MHLILLALQHLLRTPIGPGAHRKALRRRHIESLLRTIGMSRRKAERIAHHIP